MTYNNYIFKTNFSQNSPTGAVRRFGWGASLTSRGIAAYILGVILVGFYILLYFFPELLTGLITLFDPISQFLKGKPADRWFMYGVIYTFAIIVMGFRMIRKHWGNNYQVFRTCSVIFFQTCIAFLLPELLSRFNMPYQDLKNIWPLDYYFFFDYNIKAKLAAGTFGLFMLGWGIFLFVVGVPVMTYFFGKRWYCSWVCGCGGLAETAGDPFRQLSDKSLKAWKIERYSIHLVLVFAVFMTILVLITFFTGQQKVLGFLDSGGIRSIYGFWIGGIFAGVVGTGFYPVMGNRVWCRFGCPLAAYLGLIQKYKSKFRITVNEGQCISCGNCSTYCEMGIDVRSYAQKNQDIVRSSCVGCGICAEVCPRGVLNLENLPQITRKV
jgi:ferredoxin-type protein NapH